MFLLTARKRDYQRTWTFYTANQAASAALAFYRCGYRCNVRYQP